jgi:hypothetical protein
MAFSRNSAGAGPCGTAFDRTSLRSTVAGPVLAETMAKA